MNILWSNVFLILHFFQDLIIDVHRAPEARCWRFVERRDAPNEMFSDNAKENSNVIISHQSNFKPVHLLHEANFCLFFFTEKENRFWWRSFRWLFGCNLVRVCAFRNIFAGCESNQSCQDDQSHVDMYFERSGNTIISDAKLLELYTLAIPKRAIKRYWKTLMKANTSVFLFNFLLIKFSSFMFFFISLSFLENFKFTIVIFLSRDIVFRNSVSWIEAVWIPWDIGHYVNMFILF